MYFVSKLSRPSLDFISQLTASAGHRSQAFPVAVAYAIGRQLPLPAAEVKDLAAYFRDTLSEKVSADLDHINGLAPYDYKTARQLVEAFYRQRYHATYPPLIPLAFRADRGIIDFFGLSLYFNDDVLKVINEQPEKISCYINDLTQLLQDFKPKNVQREEEAPDRQAVE